MTNQQSQSQPYNVLAIISLVTSLLGFCFIASILGHIAQGQIKATGEKGKELALAGIIIGYVTTGLIALGIAFFVVVLLASGPYFGSY